MYRNSGETRNVNTDKNVSIRKAKFKQNVTLFRCPICKTKMDVCDYKDIICLNGHCFDIARTGYINFLLKPIKTEYDKELFRSRNIISTSGFFDPVLECVSDIILQHIENSNVKSIKILDAGCGEGSHLGKVINNLRDRTTADLQGTGIDISKEGILMASKGYFDIVWCVADLANLPFMDRQFDVILNVLSPSNYDEFDRVLKDDGILIKVVPGSNYLIELRNVFYDENDKQAYSNEKVIEHFNNNFKLLNKQDILYTKIMDKDTLAHLMRMTPLSWTATDEKINQALNADISSITVDFTIVAGKKSD